ncbi:hypothetical protein CBFG_02647 [Clostridiales bacterium 1_7_47FAA]|nr:hypothetical protein CBFG_02647 [Clostridiales bacterium 1_7_47FAA]
MGGIMVQWIIPCNISLYDVIGAFKKLRCIEWKQSNHSISVEDEVFIYVGKPVSSILYKCKVNRANFSNTEIDDSEFVLDGETYQNYGNYMELELIEEYEPSRFHVDVLTANGMRGRIQGPRRVNELETFLNQEQEDWVESVDNIISESLLEGKEKETIIKARVNQSVYRERLLQKHKKCCLCGVSESRVLIASHIKPWSQCNPKEKVDGYNGLLLCPNHDKVFDIGLITFNDNGNIMISHKLSYNDRISLNLRDDMKITLPEKSAKYIEYHRKHIFLK